MTQAALAKPAALPAFSAYGVEIEYMIVDRHSLDVRALADQLLHKVAGEAATDVAQGDIGWSNELALHVLELKNLQPTAALQDLPAAFHTEVGVINTLLAEWNAQLMPGSMHPWMDPRRETRLWDRGNAQIYRSFDRIFDCRQHGWSNIQSMQLNLPFADDAQFARLHAAVRLLLPILPALAASSPWADGRPSAYMDYRAALYRYHQREVPSSMGDCIPGPVESPAQYRAQVLQPMYEEITTLDYVLGEDAGTLTQEWLDVRAAVPRFARNAIEIRLVDMQECPAADLAIAAATAALARQLYEAPRIASLPTAQLLPVFEACTRDAEAALITDSAYLAQLGVSADSMRAGHLWETLSDRMMAAGLLSSHWAPSLQHIHRQGSLARRLTRALRGDPARLLPVYHELCACLRDNRQFDAPS